MCQPRKWLWGLLPLAALWWLSLQVLGPQVEEGLSRRTGAALATSEPWVKLAADGRDVVLSGLAPSEEAQQKATRLAANIEGVRLAMNATTLPPVVKPFTWEARREAGKLTLSGYVAPGDSRARMVAAARAAMPGIDLVDEMRVARGAPIGVDTVTSTALALLGRLTSGSVALVDDKLAIAGAAADKQTADAVSAAARAIAKPTVLARADIKVAASAAIAAATPPRSTAAPQPAPPVEPWTVSRDGSALVLAGSVPSEPTRAKVLLAAREAVGAGNIVDRMTISGALSGEADFGAAATFAVSQVAQLRSGGATLDKGRLAISGEALDAAAYRTVIAASSGKPPAGVTFGAPAVSPPRAVPYVWRAAKDGTTVAITGTYPDEGTRVAMLQGLAQRFKELKVDDRSTIASGAPTGFSAAMGMGLDQLSRLTTGVASIENGKLTIAGLAPTSAVATDVETALSKLVGGMPASARVSVATPTPAPTPPPPVAGAPLVAAPSPGQKTQPPTSPQVPPSAMPEKPEAAPATTSAVPASPTPPAPVTSSKPAAEAVPAATAPKPAPSGPPVTATVMPPKVEAVAQPRRVEGPAAVAAADAADAVAAKRCVARFKARTRGARIYFTSSKSTIGRASIAKLKRIDAILRRCPRLRIEISGHTDITGSAALNQRLSLARADAVKARLIRGGIAADRLLTIGVGPAKPIADNRTRAGRALNRRIELKLVD